MKLLLVFAALAACTNTSRDDVAGTWLGGGRLIHLRVDGSYDAPVTADLRCDDDRARAECAKKQRWDRRGDHVRFFPAFIAANRTGSFGGMFNTPAKGPPCECKVQDEPEIFDLRGDTMTNGKEAATRVVMPAWPVPAGWREEDMAFPLPFAPTLAKHGLELIRFAPGFFDPTSPGYWSYAFAWWPDPGEQLPDVQTALATYFDGLVADVNKGTKKIASVTPVRVELANGAGTVALQDPFATGAPVTLHVRSRSVACGARHAIVVDLSPVAERRDLADLAASVRCP